MMKKIYLMALSALVGTVAMAQVSVTFQVDMNGQTVSPNGVHVAGSWQSEAGYPDDWQPGTAMMTDLNSDGIYELTVDIAPGDYRYKYLNGNDWGTDESIPEVARINNDRGFAVTAWHGSNPLDGNGDPILPNGFVLPAVQFAGAAPVGKVAAKLLINMANETVDPSGVHVAGQLITPNWTPEYGTVSFVSGNDYAYVTYVDPNASYEYKFINGDNWGLPNESVGDACGTSGNRVVTVETTGVITPAYCFNGCDVCAQPNVTFIVDLTGAGNVNPDGAYIAGSFNGFSGQAMDLVAGNVYSISLALDPGTYDFKFQNGSGGWEGNINGSCAVEGGGNREFTVSVPGEILEVGPYCFGSCDAECTAIPDPANVTFQVDMNAETVDPTGVYLIGNITDPNWQNGAVLMDDTDADGIYTTTYLVTGPATFEYKFVNGDVFVPANEEFNGDSVQLACIIGNGQGGWNRVYTRSGVEETLPVVPFGACGALSTTNIELGDVSIYPNPATDNTTIYVQNPNRYVLRMNIVDVTGKLVRENAVLNTDRYEINTSDLNAGIYFLNISNQSNERAVYKLMVQ